MSDHRDRPTAWLSVPRRTFLKAAGLTGVSLLASTRVSAALRSAGWDEATLPGAEAAAGPDTIMSKAIELGFDPERIYRFVTDEIAYEPYAGVLRGARGTLVSRAGNSMDQALLLASLLSDAGVAIRFQRGTLDIEQAADLLDAAAADRERAAALTEAAIRGATLTTTGAPEASGAQRDLLDSLPDLVERSVTLVADRLDRSAERLTSALRSAGITLPGSAAGLPELELSDHTWVQAAFGTEWLDLDPIMPGATAGTVLASPSGPTLDALPDEFRHRIEFTITGEAVRDGSLATTAIIEHSAFADELAGQPISLAHEKPDGLKALGLAIESLVSGALRYQPVLSVAGTSLVGLESLTFATGGGLLEETDGTPGTEGEATAEWLEVRVISPGQERVARRTLFDRIGDAARAAGTFDLADLAPVELIDLDDELTSEYAPLRAVHFLDVATGVTSADRFATDEVLGDAEILALYPATFHLLRDGLGAMVGLPRGIRAVIDAPNVVDYVISLEPAAAVSLTGAAPGEEKIDLSVDLLIRSSSPSPLVGSDAVLPTRLLAGLLEHEAERLAMGDTPLGDPFPELPVESVGAVFEAAAVQGVGTTVLRSANEVEGLPIDADIAWRLAAGLRDGWVAVVPERPVLLHGRERIGWWLVDPASGAAVDVFQDGRGSAATEEAFLYNRIAFWVRKFVCLGLAIKEVKTLAKLITGDYEGFVIGVAVGYPLHKLLGGHCH